MYFRAYLYFRVTLFPGFSGILFILVVVVFVNFTLFRPLQVKSFYQLAQAVENTVLSVEAIVSCLDQSLLGVDDFGFGVEYVQQSALAEVKLFGIGSSRVLGGCNSLFQILDPVFDSLICHPGKAHGFNHLPVRVVSDFSRFTDQLSGFGFAGIVFKAAEKIVTKPYQGNGGVVFALQIKIFVPVLIHLNIDYGIVGSLRNLILLLSCLKIGGCRLQCRMLLDGRLRSLVN
ncbi:MAG: hypothetical protein ACD_75C00035G0001, partial [uncultured bacterium]